MAGSPSESSIFMKVALAQINPTIGDIDGNTAKIIEFGRRARAGGAGLVVFSELAICGYPPMDMLLKDSFVRANRDGLELVAKQLADIPAIVGFVDVNHGSGRPLFNAAALLSGGKIDTVQHKTLLPTYDVFDEDRYFEPAHTYSLMQINGSQIAGSICEDIWNVQDLYPRPRYQRDPIEMLLESAPGKKPQFLVNISASPYTMGKENLRHGLVRHQAIKHQLPVIYVNQVGGNDELVFDGHSIAIDPSGNLIASAAAFAEDLVFVDLATMKGDMRSTPSSDVENILEALTLGTRDYIGKCGFKKAVVGLSGGIDSAVVCAVACRAIGKDNVIGVAMPSRYSSAGSLDDAKALAENLGIRYDVIPIEEAFNGFEHMMSPAFDGQKRDTTEENMQARLRGLILMSLSNKFGYMVLTTGNKSELAVGYCTLYGDMCGGLGVISDLPKMMVYDLALLVNKQAGKEIIPESTITKAPSAELSPGQKDEDSLPPYPVLDSIVNAYVERRQSPEQIVKLGYAPEVVMDVITRIDRNEYKRYQAAPGLKVSGQSFGLGWRMPIAQKFKERI
jgi:NAD+ synthase (glutamine-hydrolysing)